MDGFRLFPLLFNHLFTKTRLKICTFNSSLINSAWIEYSRLASQILTFRIRKDPFSFFKEKKGLQKEAFD